MMSESTVEFQENISPIVGDGVVESLVEKLYGFRCGEIVQLNGYDDKNYRVVCAGVEYVLKIMNKVESKKVGFIEAQNETMVFLRGRGFNCSVPLKNRNGSYYSLETFESGEHIVRLLTYLPGRIFWEVDKTDGNFYELGRYVAELDSALKDFHHPAYDSHETLWMLDSVPKLKEFVGAVKNASDRELVEEVIEEFERAVLRRRDDFEKGTIHGDFNEQNIVVARSGDGAGRWEISGILDFGDTQYSCLVFELAIAITYMILQGKSLDAAGYVIAGYSTVREVPRHEYEVLKVTVAARLCQSLVLGVYFHTFHPENSYILTTQRLGWEFLKKLWDEPKERLYSRWRQIEKRAFF